MAIIPYTMNNFQDASLYLIETNTTADEIKIDIENSKMIIFFMSLYLK